MTVDSILIFVVRLELIKETKMCKLVSNGVHLSVSLHDLSTVQQN